MQKAEGCPSLTLRNLAHGSNRSSEVLPLVASRQRSARDGTGASHSCSFTGSHSLSGLQPGTVATT